MSTSIGVRKHGALASGWVRILASGYAALLLSGCASTPFRGPEQGGPRWITARSQHFVLKSSQDEQEAKLELEQLEQTQAVFEKIAFPSSEKPPGTTDIIVLSAEDYDSLAGRSGLVGSLGFFRESGPAFAYRPRMVVRGDMGAFARSIFQHELTHRFVGFHCPNAPIWFNEGLATFWETLEIHDGVATFGGALRTLYKPTPLDELMRERGASFYAHDIDRVGGNYVAAAVLSRVLYFKHDRVMNEFVNALKSGQESPADAWQRTAGPVMPQIRAEFAAFFGEGGLQGKVDAPIVHPQIDVDNMSADEVHMTWASAWPLDKAHASLVLDEASTALRLEPQSLDALLLQAIALNLLGRTAAARANMERALVLGPYRAPVLAAALSFELEIKPPLSMPSQEIARRLGKARLNASELNLLAAHAGSLGHYDEGVALAARAVGLDSSCISCYANGSELLAAKGDLRGAVDAGRVVVALLGERATEPDRRRVAELEAQLSRQQAVKSPSDVAK